MRKALITTAILLPFLACGTNMKVQTVVEKQYSKKLTDIGLFVATPDKFWTTKLRNDLIVKLVANNIKFVPNEDLEDAQKKKLTLNAEDAEPSPLKDFIHVSNKKQILIVDLKNLTTLNGDPTHFETEGAILDVDRKQIVWRFEISGDRKMMGGDSIDDLSGALIEQLKKDGLI